MKKKITLACIALIFSAFTFSCQIDDEDKSPAPEMVNEVLKDVTLEQAKKDLKDQKMEEGGERNDSITWDN